MDVGENTKTSQLKALLKLLIDNNARSTILFCHQNADPDTLFSAYALSKLIRRIVPELKVSIAAPEGVSKLSKQILRTITVNLVASPVVEKADVITLLDINNLQQLDDYGRRIVASEKPIILIDHHAVHPETRKISTLEIVNEQASSTCEVVFDLFKQASINPEKKEAQALFIGIAYDTRHFSTANSNTFKVVAELIDRGVSTEEMLQILDLSLNSSERLARLKAAKRLQLMRVRRWIIVLSNVSSYQASAARALLRLGAHVAVVGGMRGKKLRVNVRSTQEFFAKTQVHLGRDIAQPLGKLIGGIGGGHSTSAGTNGEGDVRYALHECIKLIREKVQYNANVS